MDIKWTASERTLNEYGRSFVERYKGKLANKGWTNGELFKTASYRINMGSSTWLVQVDLADYWKFVEEGRRAGKMPPVSVIENWITAKQILPSPMTLKSGKTVIPTTPQLAYLIARKIGQTGLPGYHFFNETFTEMKNNLIDDLRNSIITDIVAYVLGK